MPWVSKLRPDLKPKLVANPRGPGTMLVPTPLLVAEELRKTRRGQLVTSAGLRMRLARRFGVESACPLATGILIHIVAGAAEENIAAGHAPIAPYWRLVDEGGRLPEKLPPGPARQAEHLAAEGHEVSRDRSSGRWIVRSFAARTRARRRRQLAAGTNGGR